MSASREPVSVLVTLVTRQLGAPPRSLAETAIVTGTSLWSGGQITSGEAVTEPIEGAVVSTTFTARVAVAVCR